MKTDTLLNPEQQQAVEHSTGPLLIVAGAGTGKTTVLIEKMKKLILEGKAKPEEILALTFTEKAAYEMEERIDQALPYGYYRFWIATFHSFADQVLREDIIHIGLDSDYQLMTQAENMMFLKKNLFKFDLEYFRPLGNPTKFLDALYQHFSRLRDEDIDVEKYNTWAKEQQKNPDLSDEEKAKYLELAGAYKTYQSLKIDNGKFDFADLIYYLMELLRNRTHILEKYRKQFKYVLVDEFQDTNIVQYELLKLLCPPESHPNLTVVGDDSQAIYKFRGASISNILTFMKDYQDAKNVTLSTNYRSYQKILDTSYALIQFNNPDTLESQLGISKKLTAHRGTKEYAIEFALHNNGDEEAQYVAKTILKEVKDHNYGYADFALLVRANSHTDAFLSTFSRYGIPYRFLGPGMLFKQPEVKDLIAYLKALYNLDDTVSLYRVMTMDIHDFDSKDMSLLLQFAKKTNLPLIQAMEVYMGFIDSVYYKPEYDIYRPHLPLLSQETKDKLIPFITMFNEHLKLMHTQNAGQILYDFMERTGYLQKLTAYKSETDETRVLNITKFFNKLKTYELEHEDASVASIVDFVDMSLEMGESPSAEDTDAVVNYDAVNILTIHGSKGLEFPVVFIPNLIQGRFPTYEKKETLPVPQELIKEVLPQGDYHLQEERRLFYVGVTRAKDKIYLTTASKYGEGKRERKISQFLIEMLGQEEIEKYKVIKQEESEQLSIFDFKKIDKPQPERQIIPINTFSYSQLETYNTCGLQYKYQYVLKIPTPTTGAISFGDTIHKALQKFYQKYINDTNIGLPELLSIFHQSWIPVGYNSQKHQEKMKKEGVKMLTNFFNTYHHEHKAVMALERLFKIKIDENVYITGKIDRIDTPSQETMEIIDYKTGKKPEEKELKKSLQLSIYALAATDRNMYGKELSQVNLTFYYLQDASRISMKRTPEEMEKVESNIMKTVNQIKSGNFDAKVGPWCKTCPFKMICEAWQ